MVLRDLKRKLTGPLEEGPEGSALGGTSNRDATCWWWEGQELRTEHAEGGSQRRSALVARAGVNHASSPNMFHSFLPKTGFLSSARKDPGQSGTQNSQNLLGADTQGDTSKKTWNKHRKQEAFQ